MEYDQKLYTGVSRAAWGYFFLYFSVNIGTLNILPSFVGYLLFLSAIGLLEEEVRNLSLLRPLGILLAVWHGVDWLLTMVGGDLDGVSLFLDLISSLVNLYFHFQLLTDLAAIAARHQPDDGTLDGQLFLYRTLQTILITGITLISCFSSWLGEVMVYVSGLMAILYLIAGVCLMAALFQLRRCFLE